MSRIHDQHSVRAELPPLAPEQFDVGSTEDSLERLVAAAGHCGDVFRIRAPGRGADTSVINNPADSTRVLVTNSRNYTKGIGLDRVKILLGNGTMTSKDDLWRRQRRMIQPSFHRRTTEGFDAPIERWQGFAARDELLDVTEELSALTLGIILRAIFGSDLERLAAGMGGNPFAIVTEHAARDLQFAYKFRSLDAPRRRAGRDRRRAAAMSTATSSAC